MVNFSRTNQSYGQRVVCKRGNKIEQIIGKNLQCRENV